MKSPSALNQQYPRSLAQRIRLSYTTSGGARITVSGLLPQAAVEIQRAQESLASFNFIREE